ncbi:MULTISPECIES: SGNH/GDSL hydrolase family protein [unclassified Variovorax]|uniref:SGNH/GDSL hydrolase family protein n=1 Tax=unclassified Variovorax TaxID=663243 RepID=UPI000838BE23|nr:MULTISPECIES: SGNH/GDSL hydrolase family protein [unclassified Variovorax]
MNVAPAVRAARRLLLPIALLIAAGASQAQTTEAAPSPAYVAAQARWRAELAAFDAADRQQWPSEGGVVFVGSSSIRFWTGLAQDFRQLPVVINRGFGGSTMADCSFFAPELVLRYKPRHVLVYAGDNDLAEGRTPIEVLESFARFANAVREALPETRISFISIKPSPSREKLLPQVRETNDIVAAYLRRLPNSDYIDVFTPMMGADGRPRGELFLRDQLHLNDEGYRLWRAVIAGHLPSAVQADIRQARPFN